MCTGTLANSASLSSRQRSIRAGRPLHERRSRAASSARPYGAQRIQERHWPDELEQSVDASRHAPLDVVDDAPGVDDHVVGPVLVLVCSDAAISRFNIPSRVSAAAQIEHIKNLQIGYPVSVVDYWTGSKRVRSMLVMPVKEQLVTQEGFDSPITAMEVMLLDLTAQQYEIPDYGSIGRLSGYSITDLIGTTVGGLADL
jgi:hypothetical protein